MYCFQDSLNYLIVFSSICYVEDLSQLAMEISRLLLVIFETVPLNHDLFDPLPSNFHPSLYIVPFSFLSLSTETLNHCQKLRDKVCDPRRVLDNIVLNYVQLLELRGRILLIGHCF